MAIADPTRPGSGLPTCPFKVATGWSCPGCGSTRMLHTLLHGDVLAAARYNILALLMVPVFGWTWLAWTSPRLGFRRLPTWHPTSRFQFVALAVWLIFAVARNLPWGPFTALKV